MIKKEKTGEKVQLAIINLIMIIALILVISPLLMLAKYNYPCADDWSYGVNGYKAVKEGGGAFKVFAEAIKMAYYTWKSWDGRFVSDFLLSLQPGIFGEKNYVIVPYVSIFIMGGSMIFFTYVFFNLKGNNGKLVIPIAIPWLITEILYTPSTIESFYWWTGAMSYTFMHSLSLLLFAIFFQLLCKEYSKTRKVVLNLLEILLIIFVGGGNFSTSIYSLIGLTVLSFLTFLKDRKKFWKVWYMAPLMLGFFAISVMAPGNTYRVDSNFEGVRIGYGVFNTIIQSILRTFTNIISWTNLKILLVTLLTLPFMLMALKKMDYKFRFPGVFTLLSFGIYAAELTPTLYVYQSTGGGRNHAILYYSYVMWVVLNIFYWTGWIHLKMKGKKVEKIILVTQGIGLLPYEAAIGVILIVIIYSSGLMELSSYRAYRDYRQGWAQTYADEWDERLEILHDDSVKDAVFEPLSVQPETLFYADLQPDDGYIWVNSACAIYYGKDSIRLVSPEESERD